MKRLKTSRTDRDSRLTFYTHLAETSVDFDTFKRLVAKRMGILKHIEENTSDVRYTSTETYEEDVLSHFFCRIVCSHQPWAAAWFVNMETMLFRSRMNRNLLAAKTFLESEVLPHMSEIEMKDGAARLGARSVYNPDVTNGLSLHDVFVHFTKLIDLVGRRAVVPIRGYLKLDENCTKSLLTNEFRRYLGARMDVLIEASQTGLNSDERMQRLCTDLDLLVNPTKTQGLMDFSLEISRKYFPLCMQAIMQKLKTNGHLKYNDRQALCLFLKDCGMTVDDSITFFRNSFKVSRDVFNKEYLYSIKHNYGLVGKRANYSCFSCAKMFNTTNEKRESSCPFVGNEGYVRDYIRHMEINIEEVLDGGQYNGKCTRLLEKLIQSKQDRLVLTPIRYYSEYKNGADGTK